MKKVESSKRINLIGWEMTKGSYFHIESKTTIYKTWDYFSRKSYWKCVQLGYKSEDFSTVYEAIKEVNKRLDRINENQIPEFMIKLDSQGFII